MTDFGRIIKDKRTEGNMTQRALADILDVSDKAVSKWERNICLPDILTLKKLCDLFRLDLHTLLSSKEISSDIKGINMKNTKFYICKKCLNTLSSFNSVRVTCCDTVLEECVPQKATEENRLTITEIDGQRHVSSSHPMTKENYISFIAYLKGGEMQFFKQYPQWEINLYLPKRGHGRLLWYAPDTGLLYMDI